MAVRNLEVAPRKTYRNSWSEACGEIPTCGATASQSHGGSMTVLVTWIGSSQSDLWICLETCLWICFLVDLEICLSNPIGQMLESHDDCWSRTSYGVMER
jgi:hypothetical protein